MKRDVPKVDPALVARVRELRDRYLEHVNVGDGLLLASAKYEVCRAIGGAGGNVATTATLPAPKTKSPKTKSLPAPSAAA